MTAPTVAVSVGGSVVTPGVATPVTPVASGEVPESALHMLYVQAVQGDIRYQWVVFPPAVAALGVAENRVSNGSPLAMLHRVQRTVGNRSKWFRHSIYDVDNHFVNSLKKHAEDGFVLGGVVAVPLELDDYLTLWNEGKTPTKALRAVDRQLRPLGITVK